MKKYFTYIILVFLGLAMSSTALFWFKNDSLKNQLKDREQAISVQLKLIDAIGRTSSVEVQKLKKELNTDFDTSLEPYNCCDDGKLYHTILTNNENDMRTIGNYLGGLEIISDSSGMFENIMMYKP